MCYTSVLMDKFQLTGDCLDNAAMESFFGTRKPEFFYLSKLDDVDRVEDG